MKKCLLVKQFQFQTLWSKMELLAYLISNTEAESYWPVVCGQVYFQSYIVAHILCCAVFEYAETNMI
jgi:hypothetical protein